MISTLDRQNAMTLIGEAATAGARQSLACTELGIDARTVRRWCERESADLAAELVRKAVLAEGCVLTPLVLHADNGSPMKAATMKATLERLGVIASYSRPRVSDDNPFSEALFRTCKYRPSWPSKGFASKSEAQAWVEGFVRWYNTEHRHSGIRFVTPQMRHSGIEVAILNGRAAVYAGARAANPSRWTGPTRNWQPIGPVTLNPDRTVPAAAGDGEALLSSSTGAPAFPSRPGSRRAAASTVAPSLQVERHAS
ncbi:integrase-like protein [Humitalea rosea]|uniref:Integrase-like protein n=1 Tax=Humitalea rosea TaxID=990373 RepID=A0A2W7HUG1_9PROT|nr:integrase-like protein [Humitalea rosea]